MRLLLTALALAWPSVAAARESTGRKEGIFSLLPDGSQLDGVMLPRYDKDRVLTGVLMAGRITLDNVSKMTGRDVTVEFYNPDRSSRARIDLETATFLREENLLRTGDPVQIRSDRLDARGTGLYYSIGTGEGFLVGPAVTTITNPPKESAMKIPHRSIGAAALLGTAILASPAAAAENPAKSAEANRAGLRATLEQSADANRAATEFLDKAGLLAANDAQPADTPAAAEPLKVDDDPARTVISCDGGFYFDANKGVFVYLKNVRVTDPRFDLTGANELKIFTAKKPATDKPPADGKSGKIAGKEIDLGEVEKIVATGAVKITQKNPKKGDAPIIASGAIFSYNVKTEGIVISGGFPWFTQGDRYARARESNLTLRIDKDFNTSTEGNWDMGFKLQDKKK